MTRRWQSWSLQKQLAVAVSLVVMVVVATTGAMSVISLRSSVLGILDSQLAGAADGFSAGVAKYRSTPMPGGELPPPGAMKPMANLTGQAPGNVVAIIRSGRVVDSAHFVEGGAEPLPAAAIEVLATSPWRAEPRTFELPGLGWSQFPAERAIDR